MSELHDLSGLEQGAAIRRGEVSPLELVEHYLNRVDEVGAFITRTDEQALDRAARLAKPGSEAGPLYGVPTAIKDLHPTEGVRTTFGSAAYADYVPDFSDNVTLAIERAGLISLGKTNTPEFGSPCYTEPDVAPPALTPWDRSRIAGGSSGGAAAAVAAGLVPLAEGSDGGGSIRIPASCCGLVGFKPSRGRISGGPAYGEVTGLATSGSLARTVEDAAALLDVLAGPQPGDPFWAPVDSLSFLDQSRRAPGRLRIARLSRPLIADVEVADEPLAALAHASSVLEGLGHDVIDIEPPLPPAAVPVFETLWAVLTALSPVPEGRGERLRPLTRWLSTRGRQVSGPEFGLALGEARRIAASVIAQLAPYDAVLTPTLAALPPMVGELRDDSDPEADFEAQKRFTPWTSAWNLTGMPAVSLPMHWAKVPGGEVPVGVMLAGRPAGDGALLALAREVEQAEAAAGRAWRDRTPPAW